MSDAAHYFGGDLAIAANGDLLMVADPNETTQRILRRMLTPVGGYIWNLGYGAGLPQDVGEPALLSAVQNAVRAQIFQEASVAKAPEPVVTVTQDTGGSVIVSIVYTDATTGTPQTLEVSVS